MFHVFTSHLASLVLRLRPAFEGAGEPGIFSVPINILFPTCSNGTQTLSIPLMFPFCFVFLANPAFLQPIRKWFSLCFSFLLVVALFARETSGEFFIWGIWESDDSNNEIKITRNMIVSRGWGILIKTPMSNKIYNIFFMTVTSI